MKPDYGIDAPGVRRGMFSAGIVGAAILIVALTTAGNTSGALSTGLTVIAMLAGVAGAYGFGMAAYMTYGSRVGKQRTRERLLDLANQIAPWTGDENVLDVGCGRGLMMVGAARRLTTGKAVGVDLWHAEDQADNSPDAALENARREGVQDRVSVETGDARVLPFGDASFDVVLSHWVVHNIAEAADRSRAVDEMLRVLKPGGVIVLADIAHQAEYQQQLTARGVADVRTYTGGWESRIIGALSGGSFRPQALVGRRT
ncbi:class I SAM-dependent methyltransferase [uncultured Devosia sp.]|uniref:class I SAM-dependent methyltransferase n=1 Tax=uncultured Devosia sp. TaxID=211434 RepID=UPI0035CA1063